RWRRHGYRGRLLLDWSCRRRCGGRGRRLGLLRLGSRSVFLLLGLLGVVVDARNLDRAAVGIDADGLAPILEGVLGLRCTARQQHGGGSQELFHIGLLNGVPARSSRLRWLKST